MILVFGLSDLLQLPKAALDTTSEHDKSHLSKQRNSGDKRHLKVMNPDILQESKAQLSSVEQRLLMLEQRPSTSAATLPPSAPLLSNSPVELPAGTSLPWAWIEQLDMGKRASVERAFEEVATIAASRLPAEPGYDNPSLETLQQDVSSDLAFRLRSILSPEEFEAYLSSLPSDLRVRIESQLSLNR